MKILSTEILLKTKFLEMKATEYKDNKDQTKFWVWVSRPNKVKSVVIVAKVLDKLAVIKEYRIPISDYEFGFPAGLIDKDESIEEAATRELKEECGLTLTKVLKVSPFVYNSVGLTDESSAILYCEAVGEISLKENEASEDIQAYLMNKEDILNIMQNPNNKIGCKAWIIFNQFIETGKV